jgi:hypothetical protein
LTHVLSKKDYIPLFVRVFRPKIFILFFAGGVVYCVLSIHAAIIQQSDLGLLNSVIGSVVLLPVVLFLRSQANKLLVRNIDEVFSERSKTIKEIFGQEKDFRRFAAEAKSTIYNVREILVIFAILPLALFGSSNFFGLVTSGTIFSVLRVEQIYLLVYWSSIPVVLCGSFIWVIFGFIRVSLRLSKEKNKLKISKAIKELGRLSKAAKTEESGKIAVESLDLSFTELKEAMTPLHKIGQEISVTVAIIGFIYALPALTIFFFTHDLSPFIYYGFCVFFAVLSFSILVATELGIRKVWDELKNETLMTLERLCDKVKFQCVKSICTSEDYQSREKYVKDVTFIKSAILDLRDLRANNYTLKTASQIAVTAVLPYIPIVLKIAKIY